MFLKELKRIRIQWSEGLFGVGIWFTYIIVDCECESHNVLYDTSHSTHTLGNAKCFPTFDMK